MREKKAQKKCIEKSFWEKCSVPKGVFSAPKSYFCKKFGVYSPSLLLLSPRV